VTLVRACPDLAVAVAAAVAVGLGTGAVAAGIEAVAAVADEELE